MKLIICGNDYHYSIEQLLRVFLPEVALEKIINSPFEKEGEFILCTTQAENDALRVSVELKLGDLSASQTKTVSAPDLYKAGELCACQSLYSYLQQYYDYTPSWGIQTGVRPTKIYFKLLRNNTAMQAVKYLQDELFISPNKVNLLKEVCENEIAVMESAAQDEFSLYVSVPFCPSRCSYCSFISHAVQSIQKLIPDYLSCLSREIEQTADITKSLGLKLRTVYIGGGTPTVLSEEQLKTLFDCIAKNFDLSRLSEATLEAGRPDTLSKEKLSLIKNSFITRLTINAQSFNDAVLKHIGRNHTAQDVINAYQSVRKAGFDNINTDLIAGLEGESVESFIHSVQEAIRLNAENITIHTLALKRSSFLITRDNAQGKIIADTDSMLEAAAALLRKAGYIPYYMYRQSKSIGNLENTGWAIPDKICEYNIFMMEEVQNVFGVGAGAVTRLIHPDQTDIRRIYNFKYPYEYIAQFETILSRKQEAKSILENWLKP